MDKNNLIKIFNAEVIKLHQTKKYQKNYTNQLSKVLKNEKYTNLCREYLGC